MIGKVTIWHDRHWKNSIDTYYSTETVSVNVFTVVRGHISGESKITQITVRHGPWLPGSTPGRRVASWPPGSERCPYAFVRRAVAMALADIYAGVA